jgi:ABC-type Na+ efflux pump permease subunit
VAAEKAVNAASEPSRVIGRLVWGVCALTAMLAVARVGLAIGDPKSSSAASGPEVPGGGVLVAIFEALALTALAAIGAVVASRQPRNPIGWILCAIPLFLGMLILGSHAYWSVASTSPSDPVSTSSSRGGRAGSGSRPWCRP